MKNNKTNIAELQYTSAKIFSSRNFIQKCFNILDFGSEEDKKSLKEFDDAFVKYLEKQKKQISNISKPSLENS